MTSRVGLRFRPITNHSQTTRFQVHIVFIKTKAGGVQQQQKMSSSETEDSTSTRDGKEEFDFSENEEDYNVVYAQVGAYQDEPLALPGAEDDGQEDNSDAGDPDQLSLATLQAQFERRTPLNQW